MAKKYPNLTVDAYLDLLDGDRKIAVTRLRAVFFTNLPKGFEERMSYGMPGFIFHLVFILVVIIAIPAKNYHF